MYVLGAKAIVLIQTEVGSENRVLEELVSIPEVREAYIVYGTYDVVVKIEADSLERVRDLITNRIRRLSDIRATVTMIVVEERVK